jgi:SAM-dependent methyltransferase
VEYAIFALPCTVEIARPTVGMVTAIRKPTPCCSLTWLAHLAKTLCRSFDPIPLLVVVATNPKSTCGEIANLYQGSEVAKRYVSERFVSEIGRLMHARQVNFVNEQIKASEAQRVLEVAPGPGRLTRDVNVCASLFCLEYNEGMIEHGRSVTEGAVRWVRGDGFGLPFGEVFDVVYSFRFVRHFHRIDRERFYFEIKRVLRPGGYLLFDAVSERLSKPLRIAHPEEYPVYDKLYRPEDLREELRTAGFRVVELTPVLKFFRWQHRSQTLLGPRCRWANRMMICLLERLPREEGLEWLVAARRI